MGVVVHFSTLSGPTGNYPPSPPSQSTSDNPGRKVQERISVLFLLPCWFRRYFSCWLDLPAGSVNGKELLHVSYLYVKSGHVFVVVVVFVFCFNFDLMPSAIVAPERGVHRSGPVYLAKENKMEYSNRAFYLRSKITLCGVFAWLGFFGWKINSCLVSFHLLSHFSIHKTKRNNICSSKRIANKPQNSQRFCHEINVCF